MQESTNDNYTDIKLYYIFYIEYKGIELITNGSYLKYDLTPELFINIVGIAGGYLDQRQDILQTTTITLLSIISWGNPTKNHFNHNKSVSQVLKG